jgi:hypothetical protein
VRALRVVNPRARLTFTAASGILNCCRTGGFFIRAGGGERSAGQIAFSIQLSAINYQLSAFLSLAES